jgi:hypothetical protein
MDDGERDNTQDWLLPEAAKPPLLGELVRRVDFAVAIARASEAAVMAVGESALDAAKQARRAAEIAERASIAALDIQNGARGAYRPKVDPGSDDKRLRNFTERADRVVARLRALEWPPVPSRPTSVIADRR